MNLSERGSGRSSGGNGFDNGNNGNNGSMSLRKSVSATESAGVPPPSPVKVSQLSPKPSPVKVSQLSPKP